MANQVVVTNSGNVQVSIEPQPNVQVQISRAAIGNITVSNVSTANFANYAGNVVNANQPNITSLGTLTGLTSTGNITAPFFLGNVIGNISGNIVVPGSNTSVLYNNAGNAGASDAFQFNQSSNTVTIGGNLVGGNISGNGAGISNIAGANVTGQVSYAAVANSVAGANVSGQVAFANTANNVAGANVSGQVSYAATANSVAVGNVVGIGNIATVNLDGNASNILYGNGSFASPAIVNNVANANYANFAGTAFSVSGSNVSGEVANANYASFANIASTANSVAGANVSGEVANANYSSYSNIASTANSVAVGNVSGIGNIATTNYDGNASNILYGNGGFFALPIISNVGNANYANFAGTAFNVSGSNVSGEVANANYASFANVANTANAVAGANVSGTVANATYAANAGHATTANTVTDNAQPNITSVGTLSNLAVTGNITANVITANYINANINFANVDSIYFDVAANVTLANEGQLAWDDGDGTLQLLMEGGNIVQQIGTQEFARVFNAEANALSKGEVVYVFGAQGNRLSVKRAQANTEATSFGTVGFVAESIASGQEGFIITSGAFRKVNTNGFTAGNIVYLSPSVAGGFTTTRPVAPNQAVILGWVERVSTTVGSIYVKVDNGYEINELHDVLIANATAGQALVYNSSNLWVNGIPNIANIAYSVSGSNVSGEVANANYASYANIANTANSVAVGNVVGIGNIATINLDGNSSNALLGNGGFGPVEVQSTSIANGTSNVNIPTANGNITFSANNNANLIVVETTGQMNSSPLSTATSVLRINTIGNPLSDAHRITWFRARGTVASPTSVQANDPVMSMVGLAHNGTVYNTTVPLLIRGIVDSTYTANTANVPMGLRFTVAQTTQSGSSNTNISHNFYSNGNVNFACSVSVTNTLSATSLVGEGGNLSNIQIGNISGIGNIATINLDGNASNVLLGNGVFAGISGSATISNGTSNVNIPAANGNITFSANNNANLVVLETTGQINVSPLSSAVNALRINTIGNPVSDAHRIGFARSRGTIAVPTSVQANDMVGSLSFFGHNGTSYVTAANSVALFRAIVDSSYVTNAATIPIGFRMTTVTGSATTAHNFFSNGTVSLGNSLSVTNDISATGNVSYSGNLNLGRYKETAYNFGNATGTIAPDLFNGSIQTLTLTGNITLNSLGNVQTGSSATLILKQDATGNRKLTSTMKFASGFKTLSTGANAIDIISVFYDGSTYYSTLTTGYA